MEVERKVKLIHVVSRMAVGGAVITGLLVVIAIVMVIIKFPLVVITNLAILTISVVISYLTGVIVVTTMKRVFPSAYERMDEVLGLDDD